jgi:hypothetical protein
VVTVGSAFITASEGVMWLSSMRGNKLRYRNLS